MHFIYLIQSKLANLVTHNEKLDQSLSEHLQEINDKKIANVLKEIEKNFRTSIEGHIEYHKYLEAQAIKENDLRLATHHAIRRQVYQQILNNYTLSNSYNKE